MQNQFNLLPLELVSLITNYLNLNDIQTLKQCNTLTHQLISSDFIWNQKFIKECIDWKVLQSLLMMSHDSLLIEFYDKYSSYRQWMSLRPSIGISTSFESAIVGVCKSDGGLVSCGRDGTIRLWTVICENVKSDRMPIHWFRSDVETLVFEDQFTKVQVPYPTRLVYCYHKKIQSTSFDSKWLCVCLLDGNVDLWDLKSWTRVQTGLRDIQHITLHNEKILASSKSGLYLWQPSTLEVTKLLDLSDISQVHWIKETNFALISTLNNSVMILDTVLKTIVFEMTIPNAISAIHGFRFIQPVNHESVLSIGVFIGTGTGQIIRYNIPCSTMQLQSMEHLPFLLSSKMTKLEWFCNMLIIGTWQGSIYLYDLRSEMCKVVVSDSPSPVLDFMVDEGLVYGTYNGSLCLCQFLK